MIKQQRKEAGCTMKTDNNDIFAHTEKRHNGYKVPEGYFENLNAKIVARATQTEAKNEVSQPALRVQFRSAVTFAASFAAMVLIAITGYYFTGHKATQSEIQATISAEDILLYSIDEYNMLEIIGQGDSTSNQLLAEASIGYFDAYGYPDTELLEK